MGALNCIMLKLCYHGLVYKAERFVSDDFVHNGLGHSTVPDVKCCYSNVLPILSLVGVVQPEPIVNLYKMLYTTLC